MRRGGLYFIGAALLLVLFASCTKQSKTDADNIDWHVSLDHTKKIPYGSSIAFETVPHYFPAARREQLSHGFRYTSIDEHMYGSFDSATLLVLLGLECHLSNEEWISLLKFAKAGNEIFLLSSNLDVHLSRSMRLQKQMQGWERFPLSVYNDGKASMKALTLPADSSTSYGYQGRAINSFFQPNQALNDDTLSEDETPGGKMKSFEQKTLEGSINSSPELLGFAHGRPDFLRYKVGEGHITLHAAPLILSNYFLLQRGNRAYLDSLWHCFPANISAIYWNEYFRRSTEGSSLSVLMRYPATRWALIIAVCILLLYVLFGMKRMQRIVPVVPPVENASVSFVETVGRLYFNKGNHENMAEKMIQHFLEWVRSHYYLDTSQLDDGFIQQLSAKSGRPLTEVALLVTRMHEVRTGATVSPEYLYELHRSIQSFYNAD